MTEIPDGYIRWEDLKAQVDAASTPEERAEYEAAGLEAGVQVMLIELIYKMRTEAGISQSELARRMGVRQPYISDLERGGRTPTVLTVWRIAEATGHRLCIVEEDLTATKLTDTQALARLEHLDPVTATVRDRSATAEVRAAAQMRAAAQALVDQAVASARGDGVTWVEIGLALGMTPQSTRRRYNRLTGVSGHRDGHTPAGGLGGSRLDEIHP